MKKTLSILLALAMVLALCVPALAAEDAPAVRLVQADVYQDGRLVHHYELSYQEGTLLAAEDVTTYAYDSEGQEVNADRTVTSYNEAGRIAKTETTFLEGGEPYGTRKVIYLYDQNGDLMEDVGTAVINGEETIDVNNYEVQYDDQGRVAVWTTYTDGVAAVAAEYEYDDQGRVAAVTNRMEGGRWSYRTEYGYDDQGRRISSQVTYDNGFQGSLWENVYEDDPYFELRTSMQYIVDALKPITKPAGGGYYIEIPEAEGRPGLSFSLPGPAELTRDEAGYLTMADAGSGNYITFVYEPVP